MGYSLFRLVTMTHPHADSVDLKNLKVRGMSALRDALTSRSHSKDFAFARGDYLRSRVMVISALFLALLPFWTLLDWFMLPAESLRYTLAGRIIMALALVLVFLLARGSKSRLEWARLSAGLLLATPAAFYALVLASLPDGGYPLIGYSFIPYMLTAMLAIFPFTLLESAVLGATLIVLQLYAQFLAGDLMTAAGLQDIWLLAALMAIAFTANYFQLGLMLRLYREATHDPLTGLLNRGALMRTMEQISGDEPPLPLALLMMDLDHFKRINDSHGHAFGDDVLRDFAGVLRRSLRPVDIAARYGGEEFAAILTGADKETAMRIAERIRQQAQDTLMNNYDGEPVCYTVSIGVASLQPRERFETAARRADSRLYEAKKISRNRVVGV
ncbi:GGDEF domain-containing protein [Alcaligenaceae bacterium]|nr:GGDEF domain-containing protein [Alcaligenaceae bacterium]